MAFSLIYSLRGHSQSIDQVVPFNNDLLSADSSGTCILWDLRRRRPAQTWKAHDDRVLTLSQIDDTHVLTHSRDSTLRIWKIDESPTMVFELPINALNFANVVHYNEFMITPATTDSTKFDVYKLENDTVRRVIKAYGVFEEEKVSDKSSDTQSSDKLPSHDYKSGLSKAFEGITEKTEIAKAKEASKDISGRGDHGIIMKMELIPPGLLAVGFESGHVSILDISWENCEIKPVYSSDIHVPNPVTTMTHIGHSVITGSTNRTVCSHSIGNTPTTYRTRPGGVGGLQPFADSLIVGHWSGEVEILDLSSDSNQSLVSRQVPALDLVSTVNNGEEQKKSSVKFTCMAFMEGSQPGKTYKERARAHKGSLFVGFSDGVIWAYKHES